MSAYLIEVQDSKEGVIYPALIGPFSGVAEAQDFKQKWLPDEDGPPNGEGGYYAVHVIADETCNYTPDAYESAYARRHWTGVDLTGPIGDAIVSTIEAATKDWAEKRQRRVADGSVVECHRGHLAARETVEDCGGCPYCLYTPRERQVALNIRAALMRRLKAEGRLVDES